MKAFSSRFMMAVGLSSLVVTALLAAQFVGLLPDREGAVRAARTSLGEAVAVTATALLSEDETQAAKLRQVLGFIESRNEDLLSISLRSADGVLRLHSGQVAAAQQADGKAHSTDEHIRVPLLLDGQIWGHADLHFLPIHGAAGWQSWLGSPWLLIGAMGLACTALFHFYLRRMLRHLDPARVIPARVRTAFDTLTEGLLVLDPNGRIVLANRAIASIVGSAADSLIGKRLDSMGWTQMPPKGRAEQSPDARPGDTPQPESELNAQVPWRELLSEGRIHRNLRMRLTDAQGKLRSFMVNASPVPGANGKVAGMLVSLDDVTALEEQEIELRVARDAAQAANQAKSDFLANMSHEIRTPMNAILGFAELLRRGWHLDADSAQRHLDTIMGSGRHLMALINDILDLSKVEAGRLEIESVQCAVHDVVQEVTHIMGPRAQDKGVSLSVNFPSALPAVVSTDPGRVRQIVTNLVGNALKFTAHGSVVVTVHAPRLAHAPQQLVIEIADTGIGINPDKLDLIFEPFVQASESTTRLYGGTGLGLAISRRFARALGGDVVAHSTPGRGSVFTVTLDMGPLDGTPWLEPEALLRKPDEATADAALQRWNFKPATVLVVDDGQENRELVRLVLESSGLQVIEAVNGQEALERVREQAPALVLMDVQMPVMDGREATRQLRASGCELPVLALTANAMKGFDLELERAGFTGYLTKPVDIDNLLATLAQYLPIDVPVAVAAAPTVAAAHEVPASAVAAAAAPAVSAASAVTAEAAEAGPIVSRLAQHPRLARVARTFASTLPVKLQAMQAALAAQNFEELAELAHWLKGAGGTVGYDVFFEPALEFERHAKAGQVPELTRGLSRLQAMAARVVAPAESPQAATAAPALIS